MLAERLSPEPALVPVDRAERALMFGLSNEILGEDGYVWNQRLLLFSHQEHANAPSDFWSRTLRQSYGASEESIAAATGKASAVLRCLADRLHAQKTKGSRYFVGTKLTALDIYWAAMSMGIAQLRPEISLPPIGLRKAWLSLSNTLDDQLDPILVEHRDHIFENFIVTPLDY